MGRSTEVQVLGSGAIVISRATGADAERLRLVGERLTHAAHPGVVQVLHSTGDGASWELHVAHAGRPLALVGTLSTAHVAAVTAAVSATLGDLHADGIVHGRLDASHVLIGGHGRPVLCGFGPADPSVGPADDVAAVGALIVELLGNDGELEPVPERRWHRHRRRTGWARRSLLLIADQACAEPPSRRPSAAQLSALIATAVPGAAPPAGAPVPREASAASADEERDVDPLDALRARPEQVAARPPGLSSLVVAALTVAILGIGAVRLARPDASGPVRQRVAPADVAPSTTDAPVAPCPPDLAPTAPVGCGSVTIDGTMVVAGGHRYEVGEPGDRIVAGDWDCDGIATPALLRPRTGEVFVFPGWADDATDMVVRAVARVHGAVDLSTADGVGGCTGLWARLADGTQQAIAMGDAA